MKRMAGDTLIEVIVALLLLSLAALGTVALQGWVSASQQSARWLDLAVSAVTIVAEALRAGESPATGMALADSTAAALPQGQTQVTALAEGQWLITLSWTEPPRWGADDPVSDLASIPGLMSAPGNGAAGGGPGHANSACANLPPSLGGARGSRRELRVPHCVSLMLVQ
jgi:type II secretory pathway pseudopilin PulG